MFRAINGKIRELAERFEHIAGEELPFVCECADETCIEPISLTPAQYDDLRTIPTQFVVIPGHELGPLIEEVVLRRAGFHIVRKVGVAAEIAREMADSGE